MSPSCRYASEEPKRAASPITATPLDNPEAHRPTPSGIAARVQRISPHGALDMMASELYRYCLAQYSHQRAPALAGLYVSPHLSMREKIRDWQIAKPPASQFRLPEVFCQIAVQKMLLERHVERRRNTRHASSSATLSEGNRVVFPTFHKVVQTQLIHKDVNISCGHFPPQLDCWNR